MKNERPKQFKGIERNLVSISIMSQSKLIGMEMKLENEIGFGIWIEIGIGWG